MKHLHRTPSGVQVCAALSSGKPVFTSARRFCSNTARFDRDQARLEARLAEIRMQLDALGQGLTQ